MSLKQWLKWGKNHSEHKRNKFLKLFKARGWHVWMLKNSVHCAFHQQDHFVRVDTNSVITGKEGSHVNGEERVDGWNPEGTWCTWNQTGIGVMRNSDALDTGWTAVNGVNQIRLLVVSPYTTSPFYCTTKCSNYWEADSQKGSPCALLHGDTNQPICRVRAWDPQGKGGRAEALWTTHTAWRNLGWWVLQASLTTKAPLSEIHRG